MSDTEHAATFQAPEIEEVARLFPSYDIHALIACGGMGAVYQVTQRSLDRIAAIKILPREFSTDEEFRQGFESEAKAMAKLNHPNLIGVYDFGEVDGMLYIVMEYVDGKSLFHSANGQAVDPADAIRIVTEVCSGLENAHSHGILHRDIKPGNILLDSNASPKIGDFGLARALESQIQEGEQIFGTPGYTAPEVLEPPFSFDQRADIFSVGVMLHELLTGQLPDADPRPASQLSRCSPKLDVIIKKATNPDPGKRHSTAAELAGELDKVAAAPVSPLLTASPATASAGRYAPPTYKKKSSSGFTIFVLLLAVGAAGAYYYFNVMNKPPEEVNTPENDVPEVVIKNGTTEKPPETPDFTAPTEDPDATPPATSEFDADAFLRETRASMAAGISASPDPAAADLENLTKTYGREVAALIAKLDPVFRTHAEEQLVLEARKWVDDGYKIPETIPEELGIVPGAPELHALAFSKQKEILGGATAGAGDQSEPYILALENKIRQLRQNGDTNSAEELQKEVQLVKNKDGYFESLFEN